MIDDLDGRGGHPHTPRGQTSLFPEYPEVPAARPTDTSMLAADGVAEDAPDGRQQILDTIAAFAAGLTADEAAAEIGRTVLYTRPRVAELKRQGLIIDSGERRDNLSGRPAIVWIISGGGAS